VRVCELFCRVWQESHAAGAQRGTIDVGAVRKWYCEYWDEVENVIIGVGTWGCSYFRPALAGK